MGLICTVLILLLLLLLLTAISWCSWHTKRMERRQMGRLENNGQCTFHCLKFARWRSANRGKRCYFLCLCGLMMVKWSRAIDCATEICKDIINFILIENANIQIDKRRMIFEFWNTSSVKGQSWRHFLELSYCWQIVILLLSSSQKILLGFFVRDWFGLLFHVSGIFCFICLLILFTFFQSARSLRAFLGFDFFGFTTFLVVLLLLYFLDFLVVITITLFLAHHATLKSIWQTSKRLWRMKNRSIEELNGSQSKYQLFTFFDRFQCC